jgi:hypothetical protein
VDEKVAQILKEIRETCGIAEDDEKFKREAALMMLRHSLTVNQYDGLLGQAADLMDKFFALQRGGTVSFPATTAPAPIPALPTITSGTPVPLTTTTGALPVTADGGAAVSPFPDRVPPELLAIPDSPFPIKPPDDGFAPFLAPGNEGPIPPPPPPAEAAKKDGAAEVAAEPG